MNKEAHMVTNGAFSHNMVTLEDHAVDEDPFWLKIGATWPHKDGEGFNIIRQAHESRASAPPQHEEGSRKARTTT
jgi:hypothetical protein